MRKTGLILGAALFVLLASFSLPTISAFAKRHMGMPEMITAAKTPAEHEKLAAHYEQEAKAARAKAEEHKLMAEAYRKAGGPLIEKLHFDQHCDALTKSYASMADEFDTLAKAEHEAAKEMKK
jgi:hypothetical protein